MIPYLANSRKRFLWFRLGFVLVLTLTLSGWTCDAIFRFDSCLGVPSTPQIISLSPNVISASTQSALLIVIGVNFVPQSQIMWDGNTLTTNFMDSQHLQATITQQTFEQFGGSQGGNVLIAVNSPVSTSAAGCPISGSSATLVLVIN